MNSVIIPVYRNEDSIPDLVAALEVLNDDLRGELEAVFVIDGSPDLSYERLRKLLPDSRLKAIIVVLSRNFGSFAAIRSGLQHASGDYFGVLAADLQEPPELVRTFFQILRDEPIDIVIATREKRNDPFFSAIFSHMFWAAYRRLVVRDMPVGGVDVFGCNRNFRDHLLALGESHSSLVAQIFWLGFRRKVVGYARQQRRHGKTAWTFGKKFSYLMDSVFAFTDLPVRLLLGVGAITFVGSTILALIVIGARILGAIAIPGYAATALLILVLGTLNILGTGLVGTFAWRTYENTKLRPLAIPMKIEEFAGHSASEKF